MAVSKSKAKSKAVSKPKAAAKPKAANNKYICTEKSFIDNQLYEAGDKVIYDRRPGSNLVKAEDYEPGVAAAVQGATPKKANSSEEWVEKVAPK